MFGMTEKEICSVGRIGLVDPSDERIPQLLKEREKTGKAFGEFRMKKKNGSLFLCEVSSKIFRDKQGNKYTSVIIRDISERKKILDERQNALSLAEHLINTANVLFVQLDNSGRVVKINRIAEEIQLLPEFAPDTNC